MHNARNPAPVRGFPFGHILVGRGEAKRTPIEKHHPPDTDTDTLIERNPSPWGGVPVEIKRPEEEEPPLFQYIKTQTPVKTPLGCGVLLYCAFLPWKKYALGVLFSCVELGVVFPILYFPS